MGIILTLQDMKPAGTSGIKMEYLKVKINELAINSKNKNIRELYIGLNEFGGRGATSLEIAL
jgi:hypothetical protein